LDEIEKAHADLHAILLQVMDHATLTDPHGRKADFRHVVLILTTNAGSKNVSQRRLGFMDSAIGRSARGTIEKTFSPEFRNRLDAILYFKPLGSGEILRVVDKFANELQTLLNEKNVILTLTNTARNWLAENGFDPAMGARPMTRAFEEHIKRPLAEEMLFGALKNGGIAKFEVRNGNLILCAKRGTSKATQRKKAKTI